MSEEEQEKLVLVQHPKMLRGQPALFVLCVVLIPAFGVGLIALGVWWLQCKATTLTISNERTTLRHGLISKHTTEVWHADIRNVVMSQGIFQRMFGVGAIGVASAGGAGMEIQINGIQSPAKAKELLDQYRRAAKAS